MCGWTRTGVTFQVDAPDAEFSGEYRINLLGRHQVVNALFAIAVGAELGLSPRGNRSAAWPSASRRRCGCSFGKRAACACSTTPTTPMPIRCSRRLQILQDLPCKGRRVAVLGDMAELGRAQRERPTREVGRRAAELGVGQLFAVGKMAAVMAQAARDAGLESRD